MDNQEVEKLIEERYLAINEIFEGNVERMKAIWSQTDDATYLSPDGTIKVGWPAISKDWDKQAAMKLSGSLKASNFHTIMGTDMAVVVNDEHGEHPGQNGETITVSIRCTHTLRKESGVWKICSEHLDTIPFLEES